MATYNDLLLYPSGDKRQGNAAVFMPNAISGVFQRGDPVNYAFWANTYSGKFRTQIFVVSGSGL